MISIIWTIGHAVLGVRILSMMLLSVGCLTNMAKIQCLTLL